MSALAARTKWQRNPMPVSSGPEAGTSKNESIDLRAYWGLVVRRRWLILASFVAAVIVTLVVTVRQTKIYEAVCTIIIEVSAPRVLDNQQVQDVVESGSGSYRYSKEYYETQYKVIT